MLLFAPVSACTPSLCATHVAPAALRRPAVPRRAARRASYLGQLSEFPSPPLKSCRLTTGTGDKKRCFAAANSCWLPAARVHRVSSDVSLPPPCVASFGFIFVFKTQTILDGGAWEGLRCRHACAPCVGPLWLSWLMPSGDVEEGRVRIGARATLSAPSKSVDDSDPLFLRQSDSNLDYYW